MFGIIGLLNRALQLYSALIFVWAILSWFPSDYNSPTARFRSFLDGIVSPFVSIFENLLPPIAGMDFSPAIAIIVLGLIQNLLARLAFSGLFI